MEEDNEKKMKVWRAVSLRAPGWGLSCGAISHTEFCLKDGDENKAENGVTSDWSNDGGMLILFNRRRFWTESWSATPDKHRVMIQRERVCRYWCSRPPLPGGGWCMDFDGDRQGCEQVPQGLSYCGWPFFDECMCAEKALRPLPPVANWMSAPPSPGGGWCLDFDGDQQGCEGVTGGLCFCT